MSSTRTRRTQIARAAHPSPAGWSAQNDAARQIWAGFYAVLREVGTTCGTMTWADEEFQWEMRLSADELDGPGDEAFDVEIEIDASRGARTVTLEGYAIVAMRRGIVSTINLYGGVDPNTFEAEPVKRDLVETLSERADLKIRQVVDLAPDG